MDAFLVMDTRLYTLPCRSRNVFELRAVFALLLLPIRPRLDCCVSALFKEFVEKKWERSVKMTKLVHHGFISSTTSKGEFTRGMMVIDRRGQLNRNSLCSVVTQIDAKKLWLEVTNALAYSHQGS